jgi:transcriptional regulator with XRE-family HTH domain
MPNQLGAKLQHLRRRYRLTQQETANRLGLASQTYISNVEVGRRLPSLEMIVRISLLFGVTTDYLLRDAIPIDRVTGSSLAATIDQEAKPILVSMKLVYLRTQRHLTQTEVAHQLGLHTHAHISHLESGRHDPSIDLIIRIADLFGITTDYLLHDTIPVNM